MKMTAQNKLHLPKPNAQTGRDGGGGRKVGLDVGTTDGMTSQIHCE